MGRPDAGTPVAAVVPASAAPGRPGAPFLAGFGAPGPGQFRQAISLDMLTVGEAYRPDPLLGQVLVNLVEPVAHKLFLTVGDPALVGLARVRHAGVIDAVTAGRAAPAGPGSPPLPPPPPHHLTHPL